MSARGGARAAWCRLLVRTTLPVLLVTATACAAPEAPPPHPAGGAATQAIRGPVVLDAVVAAHGGPWSRFFGRLTGRPTAQTGLRRPFGVACDGEDLLLTDPGAGRVLRLAPSGRVTAVHGGGLESPIGVAVCGAAAGGDVVVTDSARGDVLLLDRHLRRGRRVVSGLRRPTGVACDSQHLVVAETAAHRVLVYDLAGGPGAPFPAAPPTVLGRRGDGPGELNFPTAVALDGASVWVGDTLNFRLQHLDLHTGAPGAVFGRLGDAAGDLPRLKGLAVDRAGRLWVSDAYLDRVALFRRDGTLLTHLGGPGGAPGRFSFPAGVAAADDGRVAVVDSLNRRVQLFRPRGAP